MEAGVSDLAACRQKCHPADQSDRTAGQVVPPAAPTPCLRIPREPKRGWYARNGQCCQGSADIFRDGVRRWPGFRTGPTVATRSCALFREGSRKRVCSNGRRRPAGSPRARVGRRAAQRRALRPESSIGVLPLAQAAGGSSRTASGTQRGRPSKHRSSERSWPRSYQAFSVGPLALGARWYTEICFVLSAPNGARCQSAHRCSRRSPAIRAMRSISDGQT